MVSFRATIAALASAGALALGCGGCGKNSKNPTIPAATLEQQMTQLQTDEGRNKFLLKAAQKGLMDDANLLHQALELAIQQEDKPAIAKILDNKGYTRLLDVDQAMRAARRFFTSPDNFEYLAGLNFLVRQGDQQKAKEEYDRLAQDPKYAYAWGMASHAERFGDYERAIKVLEKFPEHAAGIAWYRVGPERALKVYTDAHWYMKAFTFAKEHGMQERAKEALVEGLAFYREKTESRFRSEYADLLAANGQKEDADAIRSLIQEGCQAEGNYRCAGLVAESRGKLDEAVRFFEMDGNFFEAGRVAERAGNTERAQVYNQIGMQIGSQ